MLPTNSVPIDRAHLRALAALFGESAIRSIESGNAILAEYYAARAAHYANMILDDDSNAAVPNDQPAR